MFDLLKDWDCLEMVFINPELLTIASYSGLLVDNICGNC